MKPRYCSEVGFIRPHSTPAEVLKQARLSGNCCFVSSSVVAWWLWYIYHVSNNQQKNEVAVYATTRAWVICCLFTSGEVESVDRDTIVTFSPVVIRFDWLRQIRCQGPEHKPQKHISTRHTIGGQFKIFQIHKRPAVTDRASSSLHQQLAATCITVHCLLNLLGDVLHRFRDIFGISFLLGLILTPGETTRAVVHYQRPLVISPDLVRDRRGHSHGGIGPFPGALQLQRECTPASGLYSHTPCSPLYTWRLACGGRTVPS
ncbi:hypothetical protein E2C01_059930 [Portunus trituberculatus]|uniref:Uncharacterized protein n=1 Tax=Portunus trituberculatus TaxID=210409 RepID=A0A5B7HAM7_PORTR|nr:hypothetical protein [Portunus trituberculatus]